MKLVFATNNEHKLREVQQMLGNSIQLLSLNDIGCSEEIPETQPTIEGNAKQKSMYLYEKYSYNCFADDTGLEVSALNGEPGVISARYAGEPKDMNANKRKLLDKLSGIENRKACFKTVISLVENGTETQFEGIIWGKIIYQEIGEGGFGYDALFIPDGYSQTFAEMSPELKNAISHRGIAVNKLVSYLLKK